VDNFVSFYVVTGRRRDSIEMEREEIKRMKYGRDFETLKELSMVLSDSRKEYYDVNVKIDMPNL